MKKLSKKGVLLFAAAMALCAFAMPSMASAASWGPIGGADHVLNSPDVGFASIFGPLGAVNSNCTNSSFTSNVASAANLEVTTASFGGNCTLIGAGAGVCTATASPTNLPWTATATTTSNVQLHGVDIDITFEQPPAGALCNAALVGARIKITGTLTSGRWTGNGANQHEVTYTNATGLFSHSPLGNGNPVTTRGTFRDASQTLTVS